MTDWIRGTCAANGIDIHYLRTAGDKPPLIALHGLTGGGACWTLLARALEGRYDVIMPDARGHGASSAPPRGYMYCDLADDVIGLIKGLRLDAPVVLGHSMGGMTAAVVASEMGTAIRGLILADPTFLPPERQREVYESDVAGQHRRLLGRNKDEVLAEAMQRQPHRSRELLELIIDARLRTATSAFEVLTPPNPDFRQLVMGIAVPSLLVVGDNGVVTVETARELQELNPRLRHEVIANAGHGLHYDRPNEFAAVVRTFLETVDTSYIHPIALSHPH
jgi:pimeloyl-ACP methyl ester carboxylesterase